MQTVKTGTQQAIEYVDVLLASRSSLEQGVVPEELGNFLVCRGLCGNFEWATHIPEPRVKLLSGYLEDYKAEYCADKGRYKDYPVGPEGWDAKRVHECYQAYYREGKNMYGTCLYGQSRWAFLEGFRTYLLERV